MRRTGIIFSGLLVLVMTQGCGTTNRNKVVISKPGQTTTAPAKTAATSEVSPYSSKGGTAAKPGTVAVNLSTSSTAATTNAVPKKTAPSAQAKPKVVQAQPAPPPAASKEVAAAESTTTDVTTSPAPPKAETTAKPTPAKPAAAVKPSTQAVTAKPGQRLGAVRQVNPEYKFIVIEFDDEKKPLPVGTQLQIWRGGKVVAKAQLEEPLEHWPLGTASLLEGTPEKDDLVTP